MALYQYSFKICDSPVNIALSDQSKAGFATDLGIPKTDRRIGSKVHDNPAGVQKLRMGSADLL
jgi:hypothetical protein